jgi:hypothetical protein
MLAWLETETKALREDDPPDKWAPSGTSGFSLVLLESKAAVRQRLVDCLQRVCGIPCDVAQRIAAYSGPVALKHGISFSEGAEDQDALIACDAISVIIATAVVLNPPPGYLKELFGWLRHSPEFQRVSVTIQSLPEGQPAREFLEHFLGSPDYQLPACLTLIRKKARLMQQHATACGRHVTIEEL